MEVVRSAHAEVMNLFQPREETMGLFYWSGFAGGGIGAGIWLGIMLELLSIATRGWRASNRW